ncbi:unnamed protein product [Pleuronectes platessa]|uniref:Uncharacterized protein n=1 Tax=Pleuronectes platessa TaxID=8262 RepID=A0A9N7TYD7_PLEPL|nr:unnamed protein product [Pleuronectes platessa]
MFCCRAERKVTWWRAERSITRERDSSSAWCRVRFTCSSTWRFGFDSMRSSEGQEDTSQTRGTRRHVSDLRDKKTRLRPEGQEDTSQTRGTRRHVSDPRDKKTRLRPEGQEDTSQT